MALLVFFFFLIGTFGEGHGDLNMVPSKSNMFNSICLGAFSAMALNKNDD